MLNEFKKFAVKGNVIDLAVGVVVGTAFGKIVSSFVTDIIMPPIGVLTGGVDFSKLSFTLKEATVNSDAVKMSYGLFLNTVVDFLIISFSIFIVINQLGKLIRKEKVAQEKSTKEVKLLEEIRDLLKNQSSK
ncbi:MAG: large-conductance mechanosensitive channel protein MscL [Parcubacteria group bacterium]|jgi:large conductance mechanosensitive channel